MISFEDLKNYFHYDPETGEFNRIKTVRGSKLGRVGYLDKFGYVTVQFRQRRCLGHRLAWFYVHGVWPTNFIDHINGNRSDNRICNLREATNAENHHNLKGPRKDNKSGYLGVHKRSDRKKWAATIKINGKQKHLGDFDDPEEAYEAYLNSKRQVHSHNTL